MNEFCLGFLTESVTNRREDVLQKSIVVLLLDNFILFGRMELF